MAFWGVEVKPGKPHSHQFHSTQTRRLHISQATLGVGNSTAKSLVQCNVGDKAPVLLCCLIPEKSESCHLALEFEEVDDDVIFSVLGPRSVHLTGFYLDKPPTDVNNDDTSSMISDSYGEDIGDTENEAYDDDEDEYEDDFIDDDDIHFVPDSPRPKSLVVIEEILDDEKPAKVNGNLKRLKKKKYQVSDSDADAQNDIVKKDTRIFTVDSDDDEEGLLLSTVIKTKHQQSDSINDQMQNTFKGVTGSFNLDNEHGEHIPPSSVLNTKHGNLLEESDKKELIESKKNEAEGGSNRVPASEIKNIDGCEIERGIEQPTNAPLLSLEIGHETGEPPKKKKRKRTKDGQSGGIDVVDVQKKDTVEAISNLSNDMGAGCVGHDSEEKPKKKKKRANESRHGGVENDSKFNVQEEENFKVEARIDDTSKTEPVKDQAIDNLSNDKAVVQSSKENDVKTKKKDKKRAEERQTCEVGDDSMIDVYKEETIQVKEAVSNDLNQEVPVKDNAIDNISNDKGAGCVRHESEEKPKKMKKKRVKESRNDGVESDNKVDVQEDQNYKVEARIDDISKNESVKDQADDNLSYDKAFVHSSHENVVKTKKTKKRAKDRQTSEVRDDSIGTYKEEKFQVQEAGSNDINQEVVVKNNAIDNISIDNRGDVQDGQENDGKVKKKKNKQAKERQANEAGDQNMINAQIDRIIEVEEARINEISLGEPFNIETYEHISTDKESVNSKVGNGIHEKLMKKKKERAKEKPTGGIDVNMCDVEEQAKSLIVEAKSSDIALEESLKDEGIGNQSNEKCFVQQNDSSLLTLKIGHDNKEKQKKKKKKHAKEEQSGGVGDDSLLVVHKEVQSGNFDAKTDDVTMEERITEEFDKQTNDTIVTIGGNYVADEELTETEKNETPNEGSATNMTPESGCDAIANDAKKESVAEIEGK